MKGLILALALLAFPATAQAAAIQFDGTDAIVAVACGQLEAACTGQVAVAAVDVPAVAVGGPVAYSVEPETSERVRVPLTEAGRQALGAAREAVVLTDGVPSVQTVERIATDEGVREGQTLVDPQAQQRPCRAFAGASSIRARGVECKDASALIRSVAARGKRCAASCTVSSFRCTSRRIGKRVARTTCTQGAAGVQWRRGVAAPTTKTPAA